MNKTGYYILIYSLILVLHTGFAQEFNNFPVSERQPGWVKSGSPGYAGPHRVALLIGISTPFQSTQVWNNLKSVETALAALESGFEIEILKDAEVTKESISKLITESLASRFTAKNNILFIYFCGNGVFKDGVRSYFTSTTEPNQDPQEGLLTELELCGWINALKQERDIKVACIIDSCFVGEARPIKENVREKMGDLCIYSSPNFTFEEPQNNPEGTRFTQCFCQEMNLLAKEPLVSLLDVFKKTTKTLNSSLENNGPQIYSWKTQDIVLKDKNNLGFKICIIDGVSDIKAPSVKVKDDNGIDIESPYLFSGLGEGKYCFHVDAKGYQRRYIEVTLTSKTSGLEFEVPIYPTFSILKGRVLNPQVDGVVVEVQDPPKSLFQDFIQNPYLWMRRLVVLVFLFPLK